MMKANDYFSGKVFVILMTLLCSSLFIHGQSGAADHGLTRQIVQKQDGDRAATDSDKAEQASLVEAFGRLPLYFIENQGQTEPNVRLYTVTSQGTVFFTPEEVVFALRAGPKNKGPLPRESKGTASEHQTDQVLRWKPLGMKENIQLLGLDPQEARVNYLIGDDPGKWHTDIPTYKAALYREAYPGIDIKLYGTEQHLEYDILVQPGADLSSLKFQYEGIENLKIDPQGDLVVCLPGGGELLHQKPYAYQEIEGQQIKREVRFQLYSEVPNSYGFVVAGLDPSYPLIIDPILVYSTYLGGSYGDEGYGIAVDGAGCAYVTGYTGSTNFPTQNPLQPQNNGGDWGDAFVAKLNASGSALVYSTYLGGSGSDVGMGIAVDGAGCAYVTGLTSSTDFPTQNPLQPQNKGGWDVFVAKLNAPGSALVYSTYLGGSGTDDGMGIAVDGAGCAYVTGDTSSTDFPTQNPLQPQKKGNYDAFVAKLNASGSALVYSTYLGGSGRDVGSGIAVDGAGCAYVTGHTSSTDFPTQNPLQPQKKGNYDAFVAKLNAPGSALVYSTYLGGSDDDQGRGIAVDGAGCAYVTGHTYSTDFPTQNPLQPQKKGPLDAFVAKWNASGSALVYSTYLGGSDPDWGYGIAVDGAGCAYVTGYTWSTDFPTQNPLQPQNKGDEDAFVAKIRDPLLGWPFIEGSGWAPTGYGTGEGTHWGDDYYAQDWNFGAGYEDLGKVLLSPVSGTVIFSGYWDGYGNEVILQLQQPIQDYAIRFAHLQEARVAKGNLVCRGTPLGVVGCTGLTSDFSSHLHAVLYQKIHEASAKGNTGLYWLERGEIIESIASGTSPTKFASPFSWGPLLKGSGCTQAFALSGRVTTLKRQALSEVTLQLSGPLKMETKPFVISVGGIGRWEGGNYAFHGLPNGTYTVTPRKPGYLFNPTSVKVTISGGHISGLDFLALPRGGW